MSVDDGYGPYGSIHTVLEIIFCYICRTYVLSNLPFGWTFDKLDRT